MSHFYTPLRYPGGKQKIAPFLREIIQQNRLDGGHYVEPYAGGAGVAIELLLTGTVSHIHLNDSCPGVYSFWKAILQHTDLFCDRILQASMTVEEWRKQKAILANPTKHNLLDVGFSMFYLNRCNRSGILSGGIIGGLSQKGEWRMDARFPRKELIRRIEAIARKKKFIHLRNWDADKFIRQYITKLPPNSLVYLDPPYFYKADRLYLNHYSPEDHEYIAETIQSNLKHNWVVSYDNAPEIMKYYSKRRSFIYALQYSASKPYIGSEAFFFSDGLRIPDESQIKGISNALTQLSKYKKKPRQPYLYK